MQITPYKWICSDTLYNTLLWPDCIGHSTNFFRCPQFRNFFCGIQGQNGNYIPFFLQFFNSQDLTVNSSRPASMHLLVNQLQDLVSDEENNFFCFGQTALGTPQISLGAPSLGIFFVGYKARMGTTFPSFCSSLTLKIWLLILPVQLPCISL